MCRSQFKIDSELFFTHLRIYRLREHSPVLGDILHHLLQRSPLHLLPLQVGEGVRHEVEEDAALTDLLDQQLLTISLVGLLQLRKLHQLPVLTDVEPKKSNQIWIGFACTLHNCTCFFSTQILALLWDLLELLRLSFFIWLGPAYLQVVLLRSIQCSCQCREKNHDHQ